MDKLCYIDEGADPAVYAATMSALEAGFPATVFVYATMPLTTGEDSANVLRNQYNDAVRAHCTATGALLFDLADMEAHDPGGVEHTFQLGGFTYQKLYDGYTDDGGHLNSAGRQRIAMGWYAVAAVLAGDPIFSDGFENGTSAWSSVAP
jgi:lysophospholipase L1-like esterase